MYESTVCDIEESDSAKSDHLMVYSLWDKKRSVWNTIDKAWDWQPPSVQPNWLMLNCFEIHQHKRLGFPGALNSIQNLQGKKALPTCLQEWFRENKWAYKGVPKLQDPHHKSKLTFPVSLLVGQKHKMEMNSLLDCVCFRRLKSPLPAMKHMSNFSISFIDHRE